MTQLRVDQFVRKIETAIDEVKEEFLTLMAQELVYGSDEGDSLPVDTGAYAESMSVSPTPNGGRSRTSRNRERGQDKGYYRALALSNMYSDIAGLLDSETLYFTNQAPHASAVEYGGPNWNRSGYFLFTNARGRANYVLQQAIQTVKARDGL